MTDIDKKNILTTAQIAAQIGAELIGDAGVEVSGVNSIDQAGLADISFLSDAKYAEKVAGSKAAAIIVANKIDGVELCQLIVKNVEASLIEALKLFAPKLTVVEGVHPAAFVEETASVGKNVSICAGAYLSHGVKIGDNTVIGPGCKVGENSTVGSNSWLDGNVVVYHNCVIGDNCVIQGNSTIGACGYGYSFLDGEHRLVPHNGGVIIEDSVEIGANCCVDRAKFGNTIVGAGTKIDNFVMIAHNVVIGKCCLIIAQTGMAGSSKLGNGVVVAGQSGIGNNIEVGDGATVAGKTVVTKDVAPGSSVFGCPAQDFKDEMRVQAYQRRLPEMSKQLKDMVKRVKSLEAAKDDKK